jgi:type I restriction enzyme S subunit
MDRSHLLQQFDALVDTPEAAPKLSDLVLEVAAQGRLSTRNPEDEPVLQLVARIRLQSAATDNAQAKKTRDADDSEQVQEFWHPLPEGWAVLPLGTVTKIVRGITFRSSAKGRVREPNTVPCLRTTNVQADIEWDEILFIPERFVNRDDQWLRPDDLVISMANSAALVGKIAQAKEVPEKATFGGFLAVVRPIELDARYLLHFLRAPSMQAAFRATSSQTTNIANISLGGMRPLPVAIPPLAEQRRIVAKVEELLALCDELETRQAAAREHRARLVRSALDHLTTGVRSSTVGASSAPTRISESSNAPCPHDVAAPEDGRTPGEFRRHAAFVLNEFSDLTAAPEDVPALRQAIVSLAVQGLLVPQSLKDAPVTTHLAEIEKAKAKLVSGGVIRRAVEFPAVGADEAPYPIPVSWKWVRVGAIGMTQTGSTPPTGDHQFFGGFIPFLKPADLTAREINYQGEGLSRPGIEESTLIPTNSVLMVCIGGSIGKTNLNTRDVCCNQQINALTPFAGTDSRYIMVCMRSSWFQAKVKGDAGQTTLPIISKGKWEQLPFPLPPLAEQQRIVARVDELMRWCDALEARLAAAQTTATNLLDATLDQILKPAA